MNMEPLTLPGESEYLSQLLDYVTWVAAAYGLEETAVYRLALAVDEIATNIVLHGYREAGRSGDLTVWAESAAGRLIIYLEDSGQPFDPREAPHPPDLDRPLEERPDGGLGIYLALWGADSLHYEQASGRNRTTFVMELPGTLPGKDEPQS
jgi:anti-sigma regulatory factor (Ser/Thr protein kinase)